MNTVLQLVATCFLVCATAHAEAPACDSIDSCLEVMRAPPSDLDDSARTDASIFLQRQPTTEALKEQLYGLLGSSNEEVAEGGVRALRTHVTSADTPRLSELLGTGPRVWRLLAEIGDDAAFLALRRFALDDPEAPENARAFLSDFGDRSKRLALELLACRHDCRDPELGGGHVGGSYCQKSGDGDGVSDEDEAELLEIVRDAGLPVAHRRLAFEAATGCNKQLSEFLLSGLETMLDAAPPELRNEVLEVLSANGRTRAVDVLVERLSSDTLGTLRRLANLGTVAHAALPHVLPLLASPDTAVRAGAIQALLAFEATNACEAIAAVMRDPDPGLATAAMNAATTLCPELPALRDELARVAATYWYPGLQVDARVGLSPREMTDCLGTHDASGRSCLVMCFGCVTPLTSACPNNTPSKVRSDWTRLSQTRAQIKRAQRQAGAHHATYSSALAISSGWLIGWEGRERYSGLAYFAPEGEQEIDAWSFGAVEKIFRWRDATWVVGDMNGIPLRGIGLWRARGEPPHLRFSLTMVVPEPPTGIWTDSRDRLLITTRSAGVIDLTDLANPAWLGCTAAD